jgi:hypothetical protein
MKKHKLIVLFITYFVLTGVQICVVYQAANAQSEKCEWSINNIRGEFVNQIRDSSSIMKAKDGKILEVSGDFFCSNCKTLSIDTTKIKIEGTKKQNQASAKWSESIVGVGILNSYIFPQTIVKGGITNSVGLKDSKEKFEFKISKENEGAPAVLAISKSPSILNLAFTVPDDTDTKFRLIFDNKIYDFTIK